MTKFNLVVNIEVAEDKGEDANLAEDFGQTFLMGVFDGLGGRSAGYDGKTGGRIASEVASQISQTFFKQWYGKITQENVISLQQEICRSLKIKADTNMPKTSSRLKGSLVEHKLCTTIALASIPKQQTQEKIFEANLAWMGDSRIYFLSPTKGLQQLTKDDLVTPKDALEMLRQDPPISQYLTADFIPKWQINFQQYKFEEIGCFLACTDGCFQYFSAPWEFEKLLLNTLAQSTGDKIYDNNWQQLICTKYTEIKQDDVSLILYPVGFNGIKHLKNAYQERMSYLQESFIAPNVNTRYDDLQNLWTKYRIDYEHYLPSIQDIQPTIISKPSVTEDSSSIQTTLATRSSSEDPFKKISQFSKDRAAAKAEEIRILLEQAHLYYQSERLTEAESWCNQVLSIDEYDCECNYLLGLIYNKLAEKTYTQKQNFLQKAASYFQKALENLAAQRVLNSEKIIDSYRYLGLIHYKLYSFDRAVDDYEMFFKKVKNFDQWEDDLNIFVDSLRKSSVLLSKKRESANTAIQFCHRIIHNKGILSYGKTPLLHYFIAELYEIQQELSATFNHLKIVLESLSELDYEMQRKAQQKYELIRSRVSKKY